MAGIYIHIPYCKQACHYCDFHFSVKQETKDAFINSLLKEISVQKEYLQSEDVETIYFGGGTPSLLSDSELNKIFEALEKNFSIKADAEMTYEANPDDLKEEKISSLRNSPVNRLSIGIQSFFEKDLRWMNRTHNATQALTCVKRAQDEGFSNITIDLIYGLPDSTNDEWEENLEKAFELNVQHLSCYCLTVEPRTALAHFIADGKSKPPDEEQAAQQFEILMKKMKEHDWIHYEISNFASSEKFISQHNRAYWERKKYLGLGPSAHSFNGTSRQWNVANNYQYIEAISRGVVPFEKEELNEVQKVNEQIMTRLRTIWGLPLSIFNFQFSNLLREKSKPFVEEKFLKWQNDSLILTDRGKLIADKIILDLMFDVKESL
ncbi:MAG TPA: radical SAM family heme chaperone HemW [Chitinophagales bacterium]|nr:radical SAM family heme chaperone HemW [Chitinophagales bacterium]